MSFGHSLHCLLLLALLAPGSSLKVHTGLNSSLRGFGRTSSCPCLGWAEVYRTGAAKCGDVAEGGGQEMCTTFYEKIEDPICMNLQQGPDLGQWCYVSTECMGPASDVESGHVNDRVSWKMCTAEQDDMSREKTVEGLMTWAQHNDLMPALLMKMAYPVYQGETWEQLKPYSERCGGSMDLACFPESMRSGVEAFMESGKPVVFDSADHHPPHGILEGHKLFTTANNYAYLSSALDAWQHPFQMNTCTLYKGQ